MFGGGSLWVNNLQDQKIETILTQQISIVAEAIKPDWISSLTGTEEDNTNLVFERLGKDLYSLGSFYPNVIDFFIVGRNSEDQVFSYRLDETEDSFALIYSDESNSPNVNEIQAVFEGTEPAIILPTSDQDSARRIVFYPIKEILTGQVVGLLGMDIDTTVWQSEKNEEIRIPIVISVWFGIFSALSVYLLFFRGNPNNLIVREKWTRFGLAVTTGLVSLMLMLLLAWFVAFSDQVRTMETFHTFGDVRTEAISNAMTDLEKRSFKGLESFFLGSQEVVYDEFLEFSEHLLDDPIVSKLAWAPRVERSEIPEFEALAESEGIPNYRVWDYSDKFQTDELTRKPIIYPVMFIAPSNPNNPAYGLDEYSEANRREAIDEAIRTGLPTASDVITIVDEVPDVYGIIVLYYVDDLDFANEQEGLLIIAIQTNRFLDMISVVGKQLEPFTNSDLIMISENGDYFSVIQSTTDPISEEAYKAYFETGVEDGYAYLRPIIAFGKTFVIVEQPKDYFFEQYLPHDSSYVIVGGSILSFLISYAIFNVSDRNYSLMILVNQRTKELRINEEKFRIALMNSPVSVYQQDLNLKYVWKYHPILREMEKDIIGKTDYDIFPPDEARQLTALKSRVINAGVGDRQIIKLADGDSVRYQELTIEPSHSENGAIIGVICSSVDITKLKHHESEIEKNLNRLKKMYDISQSMAGDIPTFLFDALSAIMDFSEANFGFYAFYDEEKKELELTYILLNHDGTVKNAEDGVLRSLENTGIIQSAIEGRHTIVKLAEENQDSFGALFSNLDFKPSNILAYPIMENQSPVMIAGLSRESKAFTESDIVELNLLVDAIWKMIEKREIESVLVESFEQFRTLVDSAPDGICIISDLKFVYLNPNAVRLFGAKSADELIGTSVLDRVTPEYHEEVISRHSWTGERVDRIALIEEEMIALDGRKFSAEVRSVQTRWENKNSILAFFNDISDRKNAEKLRKKRVEELETQRNINQVIAGVFDLQLILDLICNEVVKLFSSDAVGILLYSPGKDSLEFAACKGFTTNEYQSTNYPLDQGHGGLAIKNREAIHLEDITNPSVNFHRATLAEVEGFYCYTAVPLIAKGNIKGIIEIFHRKGFDHTQDWFNRIQSISFQIAVAIEDQQLYESLRKRNIDLVRAYNATLEGWSLALELRDEVTQGHTLRVTEMATRLASACGIDEDELIHVRRGALLHDIGKIGVPDSILLKPGKLTDEEWKIMKKHPDYAFNMLSPIEYLRPALDIPYCHHEKWDGTGYPRGLKGKQIPLAARVFAVIDVWDALSSDRPYRKAWPMAKVVAEIKRSSGTHFDPEVVEKFFEEFSDLI